MGYQVIKLYNRPDGSVVWRIVYEETNNKTKTCRHVKKVDYSSIGFSPTMSFEQAKERARYLSAQSWAEHQEARRRKNERKWEKEEAKKCRWLPAALCARFEAEVLRERLCWNEETRHLRQLLTYWRVAKRIIRSLNVSPTDWEDRRTAVYSYFRTKRWSVSYAQKVIRVMNLWGVFYAKRRNKFFVPLSKPSGVSASKIHEAFYQKRPHGFQSAPITWKQLQQAKADMEDRHWNWLYLTVWFGFRPSELDDLRWGLETYKGRTVLAVFQKKLVRLPAEQRWKFIPILFNEQRHGLELIRHKQHATPLVKTIQLHVNERASRRGGRKGFVAHMWEMGRYPKKVTYRWLGHKSMRTTENHYVQGIQQACEF